MITIIVVSLANGSICAAAAAAAATATKRCEENADSDTAIANPSCTEHYTLWLRLKLRDEVNVHINSKNKRRACETHNYLPFNFCCCCFSLGLIVND